MTIPGVGQLTALAFVAAVDDPSRIRMGGQPTLGSDVKERELVVNEAEAEIGRKSSAYLELGMVRAFRDDLAAAGMVSKRCMASDGSAPMAARGLRRSLVMLRTDLPRKIVHKGMAFPGTRSDRR